MPVVDAINDDGDPVERYEWPARSVTPTDDIPEYLRDWRKRLVVEREDFLRLQKQLGRDNREAAKWYGTLAGDAMKMIRAVSLHLPWFGEPDAKQENGRPWLWPTGLADECDQVARSIVLRYG